MTEKHSASGAAWSPPLDHLRFLAALLVLAFHVFHTFYGNWKPHPRTHGFGWLVEGHTGVSLFFVLSGFLLMRIALQANGALRYGEFMRNRTLRIFPLFVVVFFVAVSIGRDAFRPQDILYLLFSNLGDATTSKQFITGAAWTISVEFTFYMAFPFLARFAIEQGPGYLPRLIALLLLLKLGGFVVSERPTHMIYSTLLGRLDQFLIGMLAAQWSARMRPRALHGAWVVAALVAMWAILEWQARHASYFIESPVQVKWLLWPTLEAIGWASVIVAYSHWRGRLWRHAATAIEHGALVSYSLYLWHALVIYLLHKWLGTPAWFADWRLNAMVLAAAALAISWVVAGISYQTIEAPFLRLKRSYVNRPPAARRDGEPGGPPQ